MYGESAVIICDIQNLNHILSFILLKINDHGDEWYIDPNVYANKWGKFPNNTPRYFSIWLPDKKFTWHANDADNLPATAIQVINNIDDANMVLDFAFQNAEIFKIDKNFDESKIPPAPPTEFPPINASDLSQLLKHFKTDDPYSKLHTKYHKNKYYWQNTDASDLYK